MLRKFTVRHDILKTLNKKYQEGYTPNTIFPSDIGLNWTQLIEKSQSSESEISSQIDYLRSNKEIFIEEDNSFEEFYVITLVGIAAVSDEKYLVGAKKEFLKKIIIVSEIL